MKHIWILLATLFVASATAASAQPFLLTTSPRSQSITGGTATFRVAVTAQVGFSATVFLSVAAPTLPQATVMIDPRQISAPYTDTATITLTLTGRKEGGTHPIIVTAKNGPAVVYDTVMVTIPNRANWRVYDRNFAGIGYHYHAFALDRKTGTFWFTTTRKLVRVHGDTLDTLACPRPVWGIASLAVDSYGRLWGAFRDSVSNGSYLACRTDTSWTIIRADSVIGTLTPDLGGDLYAGGDSTLWLAGGGNFVRYDMKTETWSLFHHGNSEYPDVLYHETMVDRKGRLWLNGYRLGLVKFDNPYWSVYTPEFFQTYRGESNTVPLGLDLRDRLWVTNGFQTFIMAADGSSVKDTADSWYSDSTTSVFLGQRCMKFDEDGVIWAVGDNGIYRYQSGTWWHYTLANSGLPSDGVLWIDVDDLGNVWAETFQGPDHFSIVTFPKGIDPALLYTTPLSGVERGSGETASAGASAASASIAPNPARERATLRLHLLRDEHLRISLADPLGRETRVVSDGQVSAGEHRLDLDLTGLESGLHFVRIAGDQTRLTRPVVVVR